MPADRSSSSVDLVAVAVAAALPLPLVLGDVQITALRIVAVLPLLLFLPGYALVSLLYPEPREDLDPPLTHEAGDGIDKAMRSRLRGLTTIDRLAVSVAASIALAPSVALVEHGIRGTLTPWLQLVGLVGLTWALALLALLRRLARPADDRFAVSLSAPAFLGRYFDDGTGRLRSPGPFEARTQNDVFLNVLVAGALVLALAGAALAVAQSPSEQEFEELAVVTQAQNGTYVMGNYPDNLSGTTPLFVSVTNNRDQSGQYVVVGAVETVDQNGQVTERDVQLNQTVEIAANSRVYVRHDPEPSLSGERIRVTYELYAVADGQREDRPLRRVYVWIAGQGSVATATPQPAPTPTPGGGSNGGNGTQTPNQTASPTPTPSPSPSPTDDGFPF